MSTNNECHNFFASFVSKVQKFFKKSKTNVSDLVMDVYQDHSEAFRFVWAKAIPTVLSFCIIFAVVACLTPYTLAYEVSVDGKVIGYVSSEETFKQACNQVNDKLINNTLNVVPNYSEKIIVTGDVDNVNSMCETLISESFYFEGCGLYVNGVLSALCDSREQLENGVSITINTYYGSDEKVSCSDDLKYIEGLFEYNSDIYMETPDIEYLSKVLTICSVVTKTVTEVIPCGTTKVPDSSKYIGYESVTYSGQSGTQQVTYNIYYRNGVEVKRDAVNAVVTSQPVDRKVSYGTKALSAGPNGTDGGDAVYFWPCARVSNSYISAYWGDGRGHKAIDICGPEGTPIYAGEAGVVTEAGYMGSYGNYVTISHGNGYSTLYAHCSALFVSVGQKVVRGEHIAAMGSTGNSTGSHVHFEVRVNGARIDPAPYLGV